jgi:hypothetical protein
MEPEAVILSVKPRKPLHTKELKLPNKWAVFGGSFPGFLPAGEWQ